MTSLPPPGFYWAKLHDEPDRWTVVEITEKHYGDGSSRRFVGVIGDEGSCFTVVEWGPRLEAPGSARQPGPTLDSVIETLSNLDRKDLRRILARFIAR